MFGLVYVGDQQRQRLVPRTRLDVIHAVDGAQVKRIGRQSVKSVGGHAQHFAGANLVRRIADERRFRVIAIDLDNFYTHYRSLPIPKSEIAKANITWESAESREEQV